MNAWRHKLKVLPLRHWMDSKSRHFQTTIDRSGSYFEIEPRLHRDGFYLSRGPLGTSVVWFETGGRAFRCIQGVDSFQADLHDLWGCRLSQTEADALRALVRVSDDRKLVAICEQRLRVHSFASSVRLNMLRASRRMSIFKEEKGLK